MSFTQFRFSGNGHLTGQIVIRIFENTAFHFGWFLDHRESLIIKRHNHPFACENQQEVVSFFQPLTTEQLLYIACTFFFRKRLVELLPLQFFLFFDFFLKVFLNTKFHYFLIKFNYLLCQWRRIFG